MKIAIFHNFLDNIGGAEIVDLILARELNADIYTTNIDSEKIKKMGFDTKDIYSIGKIPINAPFKQEFAYWKFRMLDLKKKYDFYIIAGDWAMSGAKNNKPNIWYVYSPTREIWDLYSYTRKNMVPLGFKTIFDFWVFFRRIINKYDSREVNQIISISKNVKKRVKKYLERDSMIINPPTETKDYYFNEHKNYWLSVNRLINHKRIDLQIKAFKNLPHENLIIVGSYEKSRHFLSYADYIRSIKPKNVKILSWVDKKELIDLYANCKGVICTSQEEDYGLTPIEAMASGKPVIAPYEGGYKETVLKNKTGILLENINEKLLIKAIIKVNNNLKINPYKYRNICIKHAKNFDTNFFIKKIKKEINNQLKKNDIL
jgi:glycosyltransferase involved in cell wall biosynthesis